jgi:hypothetical protein
MRCVPALFEPKNCCESKYSATTAATLPGLMRPAPMAVRAVGPDLIAGNIEGGLARLLGHARERRPARLGRLPRGLSGREQTIRRRKRRQGARGRLDERPDAIM